MPHGENFVREIQAAIKEMEAFGRLFEDNEVLDPAGVATGLDLHQCIWSAKMFLMMTVDLTSAEVSVADH